jgi:hypothetical protein
MCVEEVEAQMKKFRRHATLRSEKPRLSYDMPLLEASRDYRPDASFQLPLRVYLSSVDLLP